jgi:hypothetical protein
VKPCRQLHHTSGPCRASGNGSGLDEKGFPSSGRVNSVVIGIRVDDIKSTHEYQLGYLTRGMLTLHLRFK